LGGQRAVPNADAATGGWSGGSGTAAAAAVPEAMWTHAATTITLAPLLAQAQPGLPSASQPRLWSAPIPGAPLPVAGHLPGARLSLVSNYLALVQVKKNNQKVS